MSNFLQESHEKLQAARKRVRQGHEIKALKQSAPTLFEIIDGEISLALNKMTQDTPLDYDGYLSTHGQVVGIRRIRDLLNSKEAEAPAASQEVQAIEANIKLIKDDQKQQ